MTEKTSATAQALLNANTALIRHARFNELHQDIELCQQLSQLADEAQCMSLEGRPGTVQHIPSPSSHHLTLEPLWPSAFLQGGSVRTGAKQPIVLRARISGRTPDLEGIRD